MKCLVAKTRNLLAFLSEKQVCTYILTFHLTSSKTQQLELLTEIDKT